MIRYHPGSNHKQCLRGISGCYCMMPLAPYGKAKFLGSGESFILIKIYSYTPRVQVQ